MFGGGANWVGEDRECGIHCLYMHSIEVSNHMEFVGVYHCDVQNFCGSVQRCTLLTTETRWHLVKLACAMCVGQQCLPSMQSLSLAVL